MDALKQVTCTACGQTYVTHDTSRCTLCRKTGYIREANIDEVVGRGDTNIGGSPDADWSHSSEYGRARAIIAAMFVAPFLIFAGMYWLIDALKAPRLLFSELWPGLALILAGLILIPFGIWRAKRNTLRDRNSKEMRPQ
jgi:hypothetical protein